MFFASSHISLESYVVICFKYLTFTDSKFGAIEEIILSIQNFIARLAFTLDESTECNQNQDELLEHLFLSFF